MSTYAVYTYAEYVCIVRELPEEKTWSRKTMD